MARHYCTLFDSAYLARGLVLYDSLFEVDPEMELHVVCFDRATRDILGRLDLPRLHVWGLDELERHDPALAAVKRDRSRVEYFWTATPSVVRFALHLAPQAESMSYVDADLMFFSSPEPLFRELADDSVLIVPHRYSAAYQRLEEASGVYNVELLVFRRDEEGLRVLEWWRERCLEWCYNRVEDGKLGDQRYLESFGSVSRRVRALEHVGGGVAPWNSSRYTLADRQGGIDVDGVPLVFYHFQSLDLFAADGLLLRFAGAERARPIQGSTLVWTAAYPLGRDEVRLLWEPYVNRVSAAIERVRAVAPEFDGGVSSGRTVAREWLRSRLGSALRVVSLRLGMNVRGDARA